MTSAAISQRPGALRGATDRRSGRFQILLVEDSADWAQIVRDMLHESAPSAFAISDCERLTSACAHLGVSATDCVLLDLTLPDARGLDALRCVQRVAPSVPIVVLSALDDEELALEAVQEGAQDYLVKGRADGHLLSRAVRHAIERKQVQAELAVARELALVIGEAESVDEALGLALRKIGERTGWKLGQAWIRRPGSARLECSPAWHAACDGLEAFRQRSLDSTFEEGVGLPGTAWLKKGPVWFRDVKSGLNFPRASAAEEVGLGAGMAVPVMARDEVVAVLEFFVFEARGEDERLVEIVSSVAAQIGSLVLRRQAEDALRHSEERLRLVLETAHEAFISIDVAGVITAWNPEAEAIFAWTRDEALGSKLIDKIIPAQYRHRHEQGLAHFLRTGDGPVLNKRIELSALHRDGHEFPVELTISPLRVGDSYVFNAFLRDITARKRAEAERRTSESKLAEAQQVAHIGSWEWDVTTDEIAWSDELFRIFGVDRESFAASYEAYLQRIASEDREFVDGVVKKALDEPGSFVFDHRTTRPDGATRILQCRGEVVTDEDRKPLRLRGTAQDVTEERKAEEARGESEARYRLLAENSTDVIAVTDTSGAFTYVSPACRKLFGYDPEEVLGRDILEFPHPEDLALVSQAYKEVLDSRESASISHRCRRKDGTYVWIEVLAHQICDPQTGEVKEVQSTCRDITERKRAEDELLSLAATLEDSNSELVQFATVASHDLQEPLRKIEAFGSLLKAKYGELLDEPGRDYVERMAKAAQRMQALISNLLTLSRITTRAQPFAPVDLAQTVKEVAADLELTIEERGGRIEVGELPTIEADPLQMRQMLQNLISNSLKFMPEDSIPVIKVHGKLRNGAAGDGANAESTVTILVEDNGIGFDPRHVDRIFQVFERLHGRGEYEGTGMGLAICKKIARRHGGDITATSTTGAGATFIVSLPARHPESGSPEAHPMALAARAAPVIERTSS
jgi:PAS domain S-box-containing protein